MATVRPFTAHLPPADRAAAIASVPYDVVNSREAAALADGNPDSFLHVIRPEIDLPEGTDLYSDVVYAQARRALAEFSERLPFTAEEGVLLVYRLIREGRAQVGVVGGCSVDEYDAGGIAIHERTRPAKEDDRTRHVVTMGCQAEPIFLAYRQDAAVDALVAAAMDTDPLYDFTAPDGVAHTVWRAPDPAALQAAFEAVPMLYVADGHHRAKSASRARAELRDRAGDAHRGDEPYNFVMSVVFPDSELDILPYNRVVTDLGGRTPGDVLAALDARFGLTPDVAPSPAERGSFAVHAAGRWYGFRIPAPGTSVIGDLDCALLQDEVLAPVFGIEDPRRDARIDFVGGIRGTDELARRATDAGGVAFSLFATSLAELFAVADAGEIMPPKSTWFEPKLRSGLFFHRIA